jgi:hypothetical protein
MTTAEQEDRVPSIAQAQRFIDQHFRRDRTHWVGCQNTHVGCALGAVLRAVRPLLDELDVHHLNAEQRSVLDALLAPLPEDGP